jgi:hypothetical protein
MVHIWRGLAIGGKQDESDRENQKRIHGEILALFASTNKAKPRHLTRG